MLQQLILCFIGFCAGIIVAGGVSGLLIGLSIVPRYAGITHTADQIFLYEDLTLLGTVAGTVVTLFPIRIPLGPFFLAVCGVFFGIFLGGWILALAEIAKVFPVFARRLKLSQGLSPVIISIAAGKPWAPCFIMPWAGCNSYCHSTISRKDFPYAKYQQKKNMNNMSSSLLPPTVCH